MSRLRPGRGPPGPEPSQQSRQQPLPLRNRPMSLRPGAGGAPPQQQPQQQQPPQQRLPLSQQSQRPRGPPNPQSQQPPQQRPPPQQQQQPGGGPPPQQQQQPPRTRQGMPPRRGMGPRPGRGRQPRRVVRKPPVLTAPKVAWVQVEGLVILRIIKHVHEQIPQSQTVAGHILGVQRGAGLEITNCFPAVKESKGKTKHKTNTMEVMKQIREDSNEVGWYRSVTHGYFVSDITLKAQHKHQQTFPNAIFLLYDPDSTTNGRLSFRAFRLTDKFMKFYSGTEFGPTPIAAHQLTSRAVLEELPVKIHNSHLVHAFLFEIRGNKSISCQFERLSHAHEKAMAGNLRQLCNSIDQLEAESAQFRQYYGRCGRNKRAREALIQKITEENRDLKARGSKIKPLPDLDQMFPKETEPSRLEAVTLAAQMTEYAREVEKNAMQGLAKLFVTQGLHSTDFIPQ